MKNEICMNCLNSESGYCGIHTEKLEIATDTLSCTFTFYGPDKQECIEAIIEWSGRFCRTYWYQIIKRNEIKENLIYWMNLYKKLK